MIENLWLEDQIDLMKVILPFLHLRTEAVHQTASTKQAECTELAW